MMEPQHKFVVKVDVPHGKYKLSRISSWRELLHCAPEGGKHFCFSDPTMFRRQEIN